MSHFYISFVLIQTQGQSSAFDKLDLSLSNVGLSQWRQVGNYSYSSMTDVGQYSFSFREKKIWENEFSFTLYKTVKNCHMIDIILEI